MKKKMKKINRLKLVICYASGAVITLVLLILRGAFIAESNLDAVRLTCDAFFVSGAFLLLAGALIWVLDNGVTDGITYSAKKIFDLRRKDYEDNHRETYSEYKERKHKNKGTVLEFLLAGGCYFLISLVLLFIYNLLQ